MLTEKMESALNQQVNAEFYSGYLYLAMSAYFAGKSLDGFASWMRAQALEELTHGMKIYDFIHQRGGTVTLTAVEGPKTDWESPLAAFEEALAHEKKVTAMINDLVDIATEQKDHATNVFLQWFVSEQVEEEENVGGVVEKLKLMGEARGGLFMMDRELGSRTTGESLAEDE